MRKLIIPSVLLSLVMAHSSVLAEPRHSERPDESVLGELPITATAEEKLIKLAILPSLSPAMEDVIVRGVVRRDFELTGMFDVLPDKKAPPGLYGFKDPVDVDAWRNIGAEVIIKVAAREPDKKDDKIEVFGLAYFLQHGKDPVYEKKLVVPKNKARITAHRITDALLGAITGRDGGFASKLTYSGKWGKNQRIFTLDSDGHELAPRTPEDGTAIAPAWGPNMSLWYAYSKNYSPFFVAKNGAESNTPKKLDLPFDTSIYSVAFNDDRTKLAVAVAEKGTSAIYIGNPDGSSMKKVSTTELATHPAFSPSGKLAWVGGGGHQGTQRIYVDGKAVSPRGFTAAAPTFCDTPDGIRLVYSVAVGGDRQDLVMSLETGRSLVRLTQNQGSNSYPACSPDGRMLAFFSTRHQEKGLYVMSLKKWTTQRMSTQYGESLRWTELPPPPKEWMP